MLNRMIVVLMVGAGSNSVRRLLPTQAPAGAPTTAPRAEPTTALLGRASRRLSSRSAEGGSPAVVLTGP
jgi:hypothetical protein